MHHHLTICLRVDHTQARTKEQLYSKLYCETKLKPDVVKKLSKEKGCLLTTRNRIIKDLWDNEKDKDIRAEVEAKWVEENAKETAVSSSSTDSEMPTLEQYARHSQFSDSMFEGVSKQMGWCFTVLMGGPNPQDQGEISVASLHVGEANGALFGQVNPNFECDFMEPYAQFLMHAFYSIEDELQVEATITTSVPQVAPIIQASISPVVKSPPAPVVEAPPMPVVEAPPASVVEVPFRPTPIIEAFVLIAPIVSTAPAPALIDQSHPPTPSSAPVVQPPVFPNLATSASHGLLNDFMARFSDPNITYSPDNFQLPSQALNDFNWVSNNNFYSGYADSFPTFDFTNFNPDNIILPALQAAPYMYLLRINSPTKITYLSKSRDLGSPK
ncbi:hypothetical protein C0991_005035 [Blastosporella zonata]|nr:hypothetical protein C0991_005035 [Blastosporella zonata]